MKNDKNASVSLQDDLKKMVLSALSRLQYFERRSLKLMNQNNLRVLRKKQQERQREA